MNLYKWSVFGDSLHEIDENLFWEGKQMTIFDYQDKWLD